MKNTAKILFLLLTTIVLATPAFSQSYSFSDGQVQQAGYQQQASPFYNSSKQQQPSPNYTSYSLQDELPNPGGQVNPQLPGGNELDPTDLPTLDPRDVGSSQPRNIAPMGTGVDSPVFPMKNRTVPMPSMPAPPTINLNSGGPVYGQSMTMPPPFQQAPCCPDHGAVQSQGVYMPLMDSSPMNAPKDSVLTGSIAQPVTSTPIMMSVSDACGCGNSCGGECGSRMGLGRGRLGLNGSSLGGGLGSHLGRSRNPSQGGQRYAFFDFSGFFSQSDSMFSNGVAGQQTGVPFGHKDAFSFGAGLGRYITNDFRVDLSARNRYVELENQVLDPAGFGFLADGGDDVWTGMLTGRHDLPGIHPCIKPYLSLGIGLAYHRAQASSTFVGPLVQGIPQAHGGEETTELAWSAGCGIAFKMTSKMFFDLDYQFIDLGDAATGNNFNGNSILFDDLTANEVAFRLRFNF